MYSDSSVPIGGSLLLAGLAYAGLNLFVTGPLIGDRLIEKSGWYETCPAALHAEIQAQREPPPIIPRTDCQSLMGGIMPELGALCREYGNPDFGGPMSGMLREQERQRLEAEERRMNLAAAKSEDACTCAANVLLEERLAFAIHAGSARQITPPTVASLDSSLARSLHSSACQFDGGRS